MDKSNKKIVTISGGTGGFTVLSGLRNYYKHITAIVTMADSGGSSGILREEFGVLPPGDVRRALVALSGADDKILSELFNYRFTEGKGLAGHAFGNLMLAALERITGNFERAIEEAGKILAIEGRVLPVTFDSTNLAVELENGEIVTGEKNIDVPHHDGALKIKRIWLEPQAKINPRAKSAIAEADLIVIGPGDLYTSILPNLIVSGMTKALAGTKAKVIYFTNVMTKFGETHGFKASDFVETITAYSGEGVIDYIAINSARPGAKQLSAYAKESAWFVEPDTENFPQSPTPLLADLIRPRGLIRHDPEKIAKLLQLIV